MSAPWTCSCDAVNEGGAAFCEACGKQRAGGVPKAERTGGGMAWSPPTPPVTEPEWARGPKPPMSRDVQAELAALRATFVTRTQAQAAALLTPDKVARYLEAVKLAGYKTDVLEQLGPLPTDDPPRPDPDRPARPKRLDLSTEWPVTEAEWARAKKAATR